MNWTDIKLLAAVGSGLVLAFAFSTATSVKARISSILAGSICAFFGTEPLIALAGASYSDAGWPYVVAGALAMTGDRVVRRLMDTVDNTRIPWFGSDK